MTDNTQKPTRVLIVFNTLCFYGMEHSVIETFDILRPDIVPHFLIPRSTERYQTELLREIRRRNFSYSFFSDIWDWPRVGRPRSLVHAAKLLCSIALANWDVLKQCSRHDVLHLPIASSAYYAFLAGLYYRARNKRVIYFFHDLFTPPHKFMPVIWLATDFVHHTERSKQLVRQSNFGIDTKDNHTIPVALEIRNSSDIDLSQWKDKRIILFMGQVSVHKGLDLLAEAFLALALRYSDIALHIVGACQGESPGWFSELLGQTARGIDIKHWGYINNVHPLLKAAYVYVHPTPPSRCHESFGRGVVEAMALGTPAVCFRSGPLGDIVIHEQTGLVCEQESASCLAQNLKRFLDDPQFRNSCAHQARKRFVECYSTAPIRAAWLGLLQSPPGAREICNLR